MVMAPSAEAGEESEATPDEAATESASLDFEASDENARKRRNAAIMPAKGRSTLYISERFMWQERYMESKRANPGPPQGGGEGGGGMA